MSPLWCTGPVTTRSPPPAPSVPGTIRFPTVSLVAPVVLSIAMAVLLQAPLALMMGVLGPAMVIGGWWEQRRQSGLTNETTLVEYQQAYGEWERQHEETLRVESEEARRQFPEPALWLSDDLWRGFSREATHLRVGLSWWGNHSSVGHPGLVLVDFTAGLALVGGPEALGVWHNLVLQWCAATPGSPLARQLAATSATLPVALWGVSRLVWVSALSDVPPECEAVLVVGGSGLGTLSVVGLAPHTFRCDVATLATLVWGLEKLCASESALAQPAEIDGARRDQLWFHLSEAGPVWDLVASGPHAVVWGATGSGKSVSVVSLVSSMVNRYSPEQLALVVIDFKGGAGLKPLVTAPHTIGWVTDLNPGKSDRVMHGMRTEMVKREKLLATHDVSDVAGLNPSVSLPRLLVVVDEVAWLLTNNPAWGDLLADVLARGRSLGIHVILSTQRVSGVLTRAMMANVALRVCGAVRDEQELSEWMPGATRELASSATRMRPGQVVVSGGNESPALHAVGLLEPTPGPHKPSTWRVWVEELPAVQPWVNTSFGVVECVETQTHREVLYQPGDGSIVVVGDSRSGRTQATHAIGGLFEKVFSVPLSPSDTWSALRELSGSATALIVDDADILLQRAGVEGEAFLVDALESFQGTLILSCRSDHRASRQVARLAPHSVVLSLAKPEQALLWGGDVSTLPGRGRWRGDALQMGYPGPTPVVWSPPESPFDAATTIVVTENPSDWAPYEVHSIVTLEQFSTAALGQKWGVTNPTVVWDGVSHREVRFAATGGTWIPPLEPPEGSYWSTVGGTPRLVRPADWLR